MEIKCANDSQVQQKQHDEHFTQNNTTTLAQSIYEHLNSAWLHKL